MKKLMIALAVVAIAATSQAAQLKWAVKTGEGVGMLAYTDATVYLSLTAWDPASITSAADITGSAQKVAEAQMKWNSEDMIYSTGSKTLTGLTSTGSTPLYAIILANDEGSYFICESFSPEAVVDNGTPKLTSKNIGSAASTTTAWTSFSSDVPEPTSGLLLLLGVAGLALRRRQD